jgi:hypothetical protein
MAGKLDIDFSLIEDKIGGKRTRAPKPSKAVTVSRPAPAPVPAEETEPKPSLWSQATPQDWHNLIYIVKHLTAFSFYIIGLMLIDPVHYDAMGNTIHTFWGSVGGYMILIAMAIHWRFWGAIFIAIMVAKTVESVFKNRD